jgi:hypothetical protein
MLNGVGALRYIIFTSRNRTRSTDHRGAAPHQRVANLKLSAVCLVLSAHMTWQSAIGPCHIACKGVLISSALRSSHHLNSTLLGPQPQASSSAPPAETV